MIPQFSFFGQGLGSFYHLYSWFEHAHNDLLQVTYETGFLGILLFLGFMAYCLWSGPLPERLVLLAFLVEGLFDFPLYMPSTSFLAALAAGSILRSRDPVRLDQLVGKLRRSASAAHPARA
jgi:hypothetical protein